MSHSTGIPRTCGPLDIPPQRQAWPCSNTSSSSWRAPGLYKGPNPSLHRTCGNGQFSVVYVFHDRRASTMVEP